MHDALVGGRWDAVISELELPGFPLAEVLAVLRESAPDTPFIVVTASGGEDAAAEALVAGADDFVYKSRLARLVPVLQRSIAAAAARRYERIAHARLRLLQSHLDHVNDAKSAARDLHDTFDELMCELASDIGWLAANAAGDAAWTRVQNMQYAFDRARGRAERSLRALRPPLLELGIVQALQALAQRILRRQGIACEFAANRTTIALDEAAFFAMYGVCQESLVLFARQPHTQAIHIELYAQAQTLTLEIADGGSPAGGQRFSNAAFRDLRAVVETLGGALEVSSTPRHGTSVILSLPLAGAG
jgi:glucose-6-phosphate-specific signal transduction histidine kinase